MSFFRTVATTAIASVVVLGWSGVSADARKKPRKKPNIIVILADDYGKDAANLYNSKTGDLDFPDTALTPSLGSLAKKGILFTNAWAMPACSTTRGTRTMGKLPSTSGMGWPVGANTPRVGLPGSEFDGVQFPPTMVNPFDPDLIQRRAKDAGYMTLKLGKWHETRGTLQEVIQDTEDSGFDAFYGQTGGGPTGGYGGSVTPNDTWTPANNLGLGPTTEFLSSALVSRAIEFIAHAKNASSPYFIALDFYAPHFPYEVAPGPNEPPPADNLHDWRTLSDTVHAKIIAQVESAFGSPYPPAGTPAGITDVAKRRAAFKSLIAYMDVQIGRLMEHVDPKHTYVIFAGDNGTSGNITELNTRFNVVEDPNDPSRSKTTLYRNGIEVPFLVAGPGIHGKGRNSDALVTTTDVYATVLNLIGEKQPKDTKRDSISFVSVFHSYFGRRTVNVAEVFNPTPSVGGSAAAFGAANRNGVVYEGRVIGDKRFRLIAKPVIENNAYVCQDDSNPGLLADCFNPDTGIFERKTVLEFYDLKVDPLEANALTRSEMSRYQYGRFLKLCFELNRISKRATYFQNGRVCKFNGGNLVDPNEQATAAAN